MLPTGRFPVHQTVHAVQRFPHWHNQPVIAVRTLFVQTNWPEVQVGSQPQPQPQPPQPFTVQDPYVYDHDNIPLLHVLTWDVHVQPQATDDAWYAVVDDQEFMFPHRGSVHVPVGGVAAIHQL